jgi:type I restriction enzyme, S subunit
MYFSAHEIKRYRVKKDDLLVNEGGDVGRAAIWNNEIAECYIQNSVHKITFKKDNSKFFLYLMIAYTAKDFFNSIVNQVSIAHLTYEKLIEIPFPRPILPEQNTIVQFLDHKTDRIDRFIANRKKQIELLKEQKAAIINKAVTKGINPNAKMKDSRIEWIGQVPEHWEIVKLKYLVKNKLKYGANEAAELDDVTLPRYIRITDFGDDGKLREETFKSLPFEAAKEYFLKEGDVLFARSGATVGKTMMFENYTGYACFAGYLIMARCNPKKMFAKFLYHFTKTPTYDCWKKMIFIENTIQNIGADKYNILLVPTPPIAEQQEILKFIESETSTINTLITKYQKQIDLMQEYRTALISQAVTGKIKVV